MKEGKSVLGEEEDYNFKKDTQGKSHKNGDF